MQCCIIEELEGEMPRPARWEFSDHTSNAGLECTVTKVVSLIFVTVHHKWVVKSAPGRFGF